jgi:hypothetical protein
MSYNPISVTGATFSALASQHQGAPIVLNRAAGITVTLPAATGSGAKFLFIVGTTVTSNNNVIQVTGDDIMTGGAWLSQDSSDTITANGSTKGGIKGESIELIDMASNTWWVRVMGSATGTEATPFSAAVS